MGGESHHVGSRPGVFGLGVAETPVGTLAVTAEGPPAVREDTPADPEVAGVCDECLTAQRPPLLEVLLDSARLEGVDHVGG